MLFSRKQILFVHKKVNGSTREPEIRQDCTSYSMSAGVSLGQGVLIRNRAHVVERRQIDVAVAAWRRVLQTSSLGLLSLSLSLSPPPPTPPHDSYLLQVLINTTPCIILPPRAPGYATRVREREGAGDPRNQEVKLGYEKV